MDRGRVERDVRGARWRVRERAIEEGGGGVGVCVGEWVGVCGWVCVMQAHVCVYL